MKQWMMRLMAVLLVTAMLLPVALAEDDEELIIEDILLDDDWEETEPAADGSLQSGDVQWTFPVSLDDMTPEHVILANKWVKIDKKFVVDPLVSMKARKTKKDGSNANGGVRKASGGEIKMSKVSAEALVALCDAAEADGIKLYLKSGYRSWKTQNTMYYNRLKKYGYDDGYVAMPGASDHQTGLGCDVVNYAWRNKGMTKAFGKTKEAEWMAAHCAEYGFVIRYPADKEEVTGIAYEPWHLRYVGIPVATYIMDNGLCL